MKSNEPNGLDVDLAAAAQPNRKDRRREAAKTKRVAVRQCACCAPIKKPRIGEASST
jgi:hypothetical protein